MRKPVTFGVAAIIGAGVIGGVVGGLVATSGSPTLPAKTVLVQKTADTGSTGNTGTASTTTTQVPAPTTTTTLSPDQAASSANQSAQAAAQSAASAAQSASSAAQSAQQAQSPTTTTTTSPPNVTVPNVAGDSWNDATTAVHAVGLTVAWGACPSDPAGPEMITGTVPAAGAQVPQGSAVNLCN